MYKLPITATYVTRSLEANTIVVCITSNTSTSFADVLKMDVFENIDTLNIRLKHWSGDMVIV
jgi:hypothetical protein